MAARPSCAVTHTAQYQSARASRPGKPGVYRCNVRLIANLQKRIDKRRGYRNKESKQDFRCANTYLTNHLDTNRISDIQAHCDVRSQPNPAELWAKLRLKHSPETSLNIHHCNEN